MSEAQKLAAEIAKLRKRLDNLERASQMSWRSLEGGALSIQDENGDETIRLGEQADGEYRVLGTLQSDNYEAGVDGWRIDVNGNAEFNDVDVRGTIDARDFSATHPDYPTHGTFIKPADPNDLSGGDGIPEFYQQYFGNKRVRIGAQGSSDGNFIAQSGEGGTTTDPSGEYYAVLRGHSTGPDLYLGRFSNSGDVFDVNNRHGKTSFDSFRGEDGTFIGDHVIVECVKTDTGVPTRLSLNPTRYDINGNVATQGGPVHLNDHFWVDESHAYLDGMRITRRFWKWLPPTVSSWYNTEQVYETMTFTPVPGRKYMFTAQVNTNRSVGGVRVRYNYKEDGLSGNLLMSGWDRSEMLAEQTFVFQAEWDCPDTFTGDKTIVLTAHRAGGSDGTFGIDGTYSHILLDEVG